MGKASIVVVVGVLCVAATQERPSTPAEDPRQDLTAGKPMEEALYASKGDLEAGPEWSNYDQFTLEIERGRRGGGFKLELNRGGRAALHLEAEGDSLAPGDYTGRIARTTYLRLCLAFDRVKFFELEKYYPVEFSDPGRCVVTAIEMGREKVVTADGGAGPTELWAVQELLFVLCGEIRWSRAR